MLYMCIHDCFFFIFPPLSFKQQQHTMSSTTRKRSLSIEETDMEQAKRLRSDDNNNNNTLLTELTDILAEIKSTPSSGEISAELLNSLRLLMIQIENLSADESNIEAKHMKDESDKCLDLWFQDLVAQCEADGEELELDREFNVDSDNEDEEEDLALALALQDEEDYCQEVEKEEVCSKQLEDEEDDIEVEVV